MQADSQRCDTCKQTVREATHVSRQSHMQADSAEATHASRQSEITRHAFEPGPDYAVTVEEVVGH